MLLVYLKGVDNHWSWEMGMTWQLKRKFAPETKASEAELLTPTGNAPAPLRLVIGPE
jgi:hypothetical protein